MNNFLFYYPNEQIRLNNVRHIFENKENILTLFDITEDTLAYCRQLVKYRKKTKTYTLNVRSDNYYVNLLYTLLTCEKKDYDIMSTFFLKLCGYSTKFHPENEIVYYIYTKKYKKVNKILQSLKSHLGYFYLFFCQDIKLKEKTIFQTLKYISPNLYCDAHRMMIDKSIVPVFVIIFCDTVTRFKFMLGIEKKPVEFKIRVVQSLQMMYASEKNEFYYKKCAECLNYMNSGNSTAILFAWLDVFYAYDQEKFYEIFDSNITQKMTKITISQNEKKQFFFHLRKKYHENAYSVLKLNNNE